MLGAFLLISIVTVGMNFIQRKKSFMNIVFLMYHFPNIHSLCEINFKSQKKEQLSESSEEKKQKGEKKVS